MAVPGDLVRIDYAEDRHTYGQVLVKPYVAVYDIQSADELTAEQIVAAPVLFIVSVYDRGVSRNWPAAGHAPAGSGTVTVPEFFMQDMFNPQSCKIIDAEGNVRPATPQECAGLEGAAVWETEHIEARLRDHYAGLPNPHLEAMKLRA